ncbi:MAG: BamA/TamA family outer membrane protein [Gemmatimonadaceae bacterium]|nr:BamA/TamA family outer membrane protein [Gemmatimonadaceae bacterium]
MGRPGNAWRAHFLLVLGIPVLLCARGLRAQSTPPDDRTHPVVDQVTFLGVTKAIDKGDMELGLATKASGCKSLLLKPFCLITQSHLVYDTRTLDHVELARDVVRIKVYYYKRGYRETEVDTTVTRAKSHTNRVHVTFKVTEGKPIIVQSITVQLPDSVLKGKALRRAVVVHRGDPLNLVDLDTSHVRLRDALWDKGYADALIADTIQVQDSARTAEVEIRVNPRWIATVESVTVHGDSILSPRIVKQMITLKPGNVYKRSNVIESQQTLYNSNLFRRATIVLPPRGDSAKLVDINVNESRMHAVKLSAGFNTIDFIQTEGLFTNFNFLGNARRLDLHLVVSNLLAPALNGTGIFRDVLADNGLPGDSANRYLKPTYQASIDVTQRWIGDPRNSLGLGLFSHRSSVPGIYIDKGYGASISFTRNLAPHTPLSLVYRYEETQVEAGDVYFCVNYGVCEPGTIGLLRNRNALSPVSLDYFMDRSNDPFNASEGYTARADFEHASKYTLSDFRYYRASGEGTMYWPVGKSVLAAHIRGGWVKAMSSSSTSSSDGLADILHPRKRFYAGGANSVRGYGENQLGPRILTVDPAKLLAAGCTSASISDGSCNPNGAGINGNGDSVRVSSNDFNALPTGGTSLIEGSIEYRFPMIMKHLQGAVFIDAGYVGVGASSVTSGTGAITPGFGVRYLSPVGPIRVDLGFRPSLTDQLTVITEEVAPDGTRKLVQLDTPRDYNPVEGGSGISKILNRLALHLSIGQAF